jgi:hypothetical protein
MIPASMERAYSDVRSSRSVGWTKPRAWPRRMMVAFEMRFSGMR